ncbi:MAG: hypothetical protein QY309_05695 [Cyclobacteriaceae bacterium]|nr:MAG: hypothetical protein QY309_05695 [Cyclobacteriaceae bacterium]
MKLPAKLPLLIAVLACFYNTSKAQIDPTWEYFHYKNDGTRGPGPGTSGTFINIDIRLAADYPNDPGRQYYLTEGSTFSFRRTSSTGPLTNTYHPMAGFNSTNYTQGQLRSVGQWQGDIFQMNYRLLFPRNYATNPDVEGGYPMIVMIHGFGERGNCWDNNCYHNNKNWNPNANNPAAAWNNNSLLNNDHSMTHGGAVHQTAVRTTTPAGMPPDDPNMPARAFPGFVLFPQNLNGWAHWDSPDENVVRIIRLLILTYNINPNKIYIHGLSDGGAGVYRIIRCAPWLFAGALPMSAVNGAETNEYKMHPYIASIPIWTFQGGTDRNPWPWQTEARVLDFRNNGMDVRYTLYPTLGHGVWNNAYNEPDFFSWMMKKDKANIHVKFNNPTVCSTSGASAELILAQGFRAYQWEKDGELIPGANSHSYSASLPGTYRARFSRVLNPGLNDWNRWSDPVVVTESAPDKPVIEALGSTIFPTINDPSQRTVILKSSEKNTKYYWYKNGSLVTNANTFDDNYTGVQDTLSLLLRKIDNLDAGTYTLRTADISGCESLQSTPVFITFNSPLDIPLPSNFTGSAKSPSSIFLSWNDNSPSEVGFEIWRRKAGETTFSFIALTTEDAVGYLDTQLAPNTTYHYKLRAVSNTARSNHVPSDDLNTNLVVITPGETTLPTPPQNVEVIFNSINSISLSWDAGSDDNGVNRYKVNYGSNSVYTSSPTTSYTISGLPINNAYPITVQTEDLAGNLSPPSNQVIGTTFIDGLYYEHSTGAWKSLDPVISASTTGGGSIPPDNPPIDWVTAEFTGKIANFNASPITYPVDANGVKGIATQEEFYKIKFDGYINITTAGFNDNYQFRTNSDDGSMLFIGGFNPNDVTQFRVVNNDGLHGQQWRETDANSTNVLAPVGYHRIVVLFNEYTGGQSLQVQYRRRTGSSSYTSWMPIPNSMLKSGTYTLPDPLVPPSNIIALGSGMTSIDLTWAYGVSPAHEFEVYRAIAFDGDYSIVARAIGLAFTDETTEPGTTYFYKLRTIDTSNGASSPLSSAVSATTDSDAIAPSIPINLTLVSKTFSNVVFNWAESTDNVAVTGYEILVNNIPVDTTTVTSYMATGLEPGTLYNFTVKAFDASENKSAASSVLAVTTNVGQMYFSKATGALGNAGTWGINPDGSNPIGVNPPDLTYNGQYYMVANRTSTDLGGVALNIGGSISKVIIPSGTTFTVNSSISAKLEVQGTAVVNLNHATAPEFLSVSPTSTVYFNTYNYIPAGTYGNVNLTGTGNKNFEAGDITIMGNLTATNGIALKGVPGNASRVTVHGDITLAGTPGVVATDNALDLTLAKAGTQTLTVNGTLDLFRISTAASTTANVVNGGSAVTINMGSPNGGGLALANGSTLNLGNNHLVMKNAASINAGGQTGRLAINGSNLTLNSSSAQNSNLHIDNVLNTAGMVTSNFTSTGKLNIQTPLRITDGLKIKAGEFNASGSDILEPANVTLVSTDTKTAYLQEIEGNGSITGNAKVERWVSIARKYRYMSSSVANMTVANWQLHMPITGPFTGSSPNSPNPSMFYYVENDNGYKNYPHTGTDNSVTFERGRGYSIFNYNGNSPLTLTMTGQPYQGSVPYTLTPGTGSTQNGGDGWNLVGNPYASAISWNNLVSDWTKSGLSPVVHVPDNTDPQGLQFKTWNANTNTGTLTDGIIAPGQAFWVQTVTSNPTLTIHEKAKRTNTSTFFRESEAASGSITIVLSNGTREDEAYIIIGDAYVDSYEPGVDGMKLKNQVLNLSTLSSEDAKLTYNNISSSFCEKIVRLSIDDVTPGTYLLAFENIENLVGVGTIELTDHFTGNTLSLTGNDSYSFAVTSDAASYGAERFTLTIYRPELHKDAIATIGDVCVVKQHLFNSATRRKVCSIMLRLLMTKPRYLKSCRVMMGTSRLPCLLMPCKRV